MSNGQYLSKAWNICQPHFGNQRGNDYRKILMRYVIVLKYGQIQVHFNYNHFSNRVSLTGWLAHTHTHTHTPHPKRCVKVRSPRICVCGLIWKLSLQRCNQVRIRKSGWTLMGLVSLWEEGSLDTDTWRTPHGRAEIRVMQLQAKDCWPAWETRKMQGAVPSCRV